MYPIIVDLTGRRCVVVGGGTVGERRVVGLLEQGANVRLVSPEATDRLRGLADEGRITWVNGTYRSEHIDDAFLVVASTDSRETNADVVRDADGRNILAANTSAAEEGNFIVPGVVRQGDLLLAVSTLGQSPTLASVLREDLEERYGPEWALLTSILGRLREELKARQSTDDGRKQAVRRVIASDEVWDALRRGDRAEAELAARDCLA